MTPRNTQPKASAKAHSSSARRGDVARSTGPRRTGVLRASAPTRASNSAPRSSDHRAHPTASRAQDQNRSKRRSFRDASWFRWWLVPIFVVAAVALFVAGYYPVARVQYRETRERARLLAQYDALTARNRRLTAEVARLKTPEGVEDYARSELGMVKAGENVVIVVDGNNQPSTPATLGALPELDNSGETPEPPRGPWTAFLDSVFNVQ